MNAEKFKELYDEDELEEVYEEIDDGWRHGNDYYTVFEYPVDGTFWAVQYRVSGDGEYHGIRENEFTFLGQVKPIKKIVETIEYVSVNEKK